MIKLNPLYWVWWFLTGEFMQYTNGSKPYLKSNGLWSDKV